MPPPGWRDGDSGLRLAAAVTLLNGHFRHKFVMLSSSLVQVARTAPTIGRHERPAVC
jgi:hypothetical protein